MALDEVFWHCASSPRLRFYQWDHPALSFGYFGRYTDVESYRSDRELVRRCTGGGVVLHGTDLTYALIIPATDSRPEASPLTVYARVHRAIQTALQRVDVKARLVPATDCSRFAPRKASRGSHDKADRVPPEATSTDTCFANPVAHDVMVDDCKVAGAAQRRSRRGLLQQGSIQNVAVSDEFREYFIAELSGSSVIGATDSAVLGQAQQLAEAKYGTEEWLHRV